MQVNLNYGKGVLRISLRASWDVTIVRKPKMPIYLEPPAAVDDPLYFTATASVDELTLGGFEITGVEEGTPAELKLISDADGLRLSVKGATTILGAT